MPDRQHDVIEGFLDQLDPTQHAEEITEQAWIVNAIEELEGGAILFRYATQQTEFSDWAASGFRPLSVRDLRLQRGLFLPNASEYHLEPRRAQFDPAR